MSEAEAKLVSKLQGHRGCLIQLNDMTYWFEKLDRSGNLGQVCLLMDAEYTSAVHVVPATTKSAVNTSSACCDVQLLIDSTLTWVHVTEADVVFL
jgi:hypothetical protein